MNARSTSFEFTCLSKRINDIVSAIFHSVIFNRCFGKFHFKSENSYSIGTLGFEEVICDFIDFTYIRVASLELAKVINQHIKKFVEELRMLALNSQTNAASPTNRQIANLPIPSTFRRPSLLNVVEPPSPQQRRFSSHQEFALLSPLYAAATGSISLEFLLKSKSFAFSDSLIWEVWTLKINCLKDETNESLFNRTSIEDQLLDKILSIVSVVNNTNAFLPQMPSESELDNVFDISYPDAQPYNFKISYRIGKDSNDSRTSGSSDRGGLLSPGRLRQIFDKFSL